MKYLFTREQLSALLLGTIDMYDEYLNVHGHESESAKYSAVNEMFDGMAGEIDLFAGGELNESERSFTPVE